MAPGKCGISMTFAGVVDETAWPDLVGRTIGLFAGLSAGEEFAKNIFKHFHQLPIKRFRTEKSFSENVPEAGSSTGLFATFAAFCSVSSNDLV